jgi:hypothetical protein
MKKKIIPCLLLASLLFYIGCYNSTQPITKDELKAEVEYDINVFTKDSLEYRFYKGNYSIQGDTLSGTGVQVVAHDWPNTKHFNGSMPLSEITKLTAEKFSLGWTIAAVLFPILLVGGFFIIAYANAAS